MPENFPSQSQQSQSFIANSITSYFEQVQLAVSRLDTTQIAQAVEAILAAHYRQSTIFIFGNGGSASTATHFANDLAKGCSVEGQQRFRAISLTDNVALMTAWANDTHYENIFAEQLRGLVRAGDLVIGISGSGNSPNVLKAMEIGRTEGAVTIGFCGFGGGKLRGLVELAVSTDCNVMEQVEDIHMSVCHNIATTLRKTLLLAPVPTKKLGEISITAEKTQAEALTIGGE